MYLRIEQMYISQERVSHLTTLCYRPGRKHEVFVYSGTSYCHVSQKQSTAYRIKYLLRVFRFVIQVMVAPQRCSLPGHRAVLFLKSNSPMENCRKSRQRADAVRENEREGDRAKEEGDRMVTEKGLSCE